MSFESAARDALRLLQGPDAKAPLPVFNFRVTFREASFSAPGGADTVPLADGAFAEVSGLEASIEAKTIREGGFNTGQHQRVGGVSHGTVVLRRGMARAHQLVRWFEVFTGAQYGCRLDVDIELLGPDGSTQLVCELTRAMPVRYKAADFNARSAEIGIEELHLVHESMAWRGPPESTLTDRIVGAAASAGLAGLQVAGGAGLGGVRL
jgi:phage tail-like protein